MKDLKDFETHLSARSVIYGILSQAIYMVSWRMSASEFLWPGTPKIDPSKKHRDLPEAVTHENLTQVLELTVMTLEWAFCWGRRCEVS